MSRSSPRRFWNASPSSSAGAAAALCGAAAPRATARIAAATAGVTRGSKTLGHDHRRVQLVLADHIRDRPGRCERHLLGERLGAHVGIHRNPPGTPAGC
jgi:hypothetical protein